MPKKLIAVTNVKIGNGEGEFFAAGTEVDHTKFTKAQLTELHDAGAVEIRVVEDEPTATETQQADDSGATPTQNEGERPAENE